MSDSEPFIKTDADEFVRKMREARAELVGERGPEIVHLPPGTLVQPSSADGADG